MMPDGEFDRESALRSLIQRAKDLSAEKRHSEAFLRWERGVLSFVRALYGSDSVQFLELANIFQDLFNSRYDNSPGLETTLRERLDQAREILTAIAANITSQQPSIHSAKEGQSSKALDGRATVQMPPDTPAHHIIARKRVTREFDVFLSHNSKDKHLVKNIATRLLEAGILPWLDEWDLRPGDRIVGAIDEIIRTSKAAAVLIGPHGFGPWHDLEQEALLEQFVYRHLPVIPVILPGVEGRPTVPVLLGGSKWVDFRLAEPDPLDELVWGILGQKPSF